MTVAPRDGDWTSKRCVELRALVVRCAHDHRRGRRMAAAEQLRRVVEETAALLHRLEQGAGPMGDAWSRAARGIAACLEGVAEAQRHHDPFGLADRLEHELALLLEALAPSLDERPA